MINKYKVDAEQWKAWGPLGQRVFNGVFFSMGQQRTFIHPDAWPHETKHWKTTRWNAAWVAADYATGKY